MADDMFYAISFVKEVASDIQESSVDQLLQRWIEFAIQGEITINWNAHNNLGEDTQKYPRWPVLRLRSQKWLAAVHGVDA